MTNEQIEQKIKELRELQRKQLNEQRKKEREKERKLKEKNSKIIADLTRLYYSSKTDEEIINIWYATIKKNTPEKTTLANRIVGKQD